MPKSQKTPPPPPIQQGPPTLKQFEALSINDKELYLITIFGKNAIDGNSWSLLKAAEIDKEYEKLLKDPNYQPTFLISNAPQIPSKQPTTQTPPTLQTPSLKVISLSTFKAKKDEQIGHFKTLCLIILIRE